MSHLFENSMLYTAVEYHKASFSPARQAITTGLDLFRNPFSPYAYHPHAKNLSAVYELLERITREYKKPEFGIYETEIQGEKIPVVQLKVIRKPFCNVLHFRKLSDLKLPKLLIVAPMAGHHSTLLRGTVEACLPFFDVYITDWIDARYVPLSDGSFNMDDFIDYVTEFMDQLGPNLNVMAVCQPTVPVLAAVAMMSESDKKHKLPSSMVMIGGPIDTRKSPTEVNVFATNRSMSWFEANVITRVPINYPGFMRPVYPGFIQLAGFIAMNLGKHLNAHFKMYQHLVVGDGETAESQKKFYNEYLSVMDLPAEFYLQTIKQVFKEHAMPLGKMSSRGRKVDLASITKSSLLCIEGELDDIAGLDQTKAAITICKNIPKENKEYFMQKGVGHYGVFNGRKFRDNIMPKIVEFCYKHSGFGSKIITPDEKTKKQG